MNDLQMPGLNRRQHDTWDRMTGWNSGFKVVDIDTADVYRPIHGDRFGMDEVIVRAKVQHPKLEYVRPGTWVVELKSAVSAEPPLPEDGELNVLVDYDDKDDDEDRDGSTMLGRVKYSGGAERYQRKAGAHYGSLELANTFLFDEPRDPWYHRNGWVARSLLLPYWSQASHECPVTFTVFQLLRSAYWRNTPPGSSSMDLSNRARY